MFMIYNASKITYCTSYKQMVIIWLSLWSVLKNVKDDLCALCKWWNVIIRKYCIVCKEKLYLGISRGKGDRK